MTPLSLPEGQSLMVSDISDITRAQRSAREMAAALGFDELAREEVALAASELASNLLRHAKGGLLHLTPLADGNHVGIRIESLDSGPGIPDAERAITDGFSTAGGLGCGLGSVNRLMDTLDISPRQGPERGTRVACARWLRPKEAHPIPCPLDFGAATRARLTETDNGDTFVIKRWGTGALVAVSVAWVVLGAMAAWR